MPAQPGVHRRARGGVEAQEGVEGIAALVGAIHALAPGGAAEDVGGVEVQGDLAHAGGGPGVALDGGEGLVELADVAEAEPPQPGSRRLGGGDAEAPQLLLGLIGADDGQVVEAGGAHCDRLGHASRELRFGQPSGPLFEMNVAVTASANPTTRIVSRSSSAPP